MAASELPAASESPTKQSPPSESQEPAGHPESSSRDEQVLPETQEERALRTLRAIAAGGDLTAETMKLSNEYTDRHTAQFSDWFRRVILRRK